MWTLKQKRQLQRQRQSTSAACCNPIHAESAGAKQKHAPTPCGHSTNLSYSCPTHISDSQHLRQSKTVTHIMWTPMWTLSCLMKTKTVTHWHRLNTEDDPNKSENHHQLDTHSFLDAKRKRIKSPLDLKSFWTPFGHFGALGTGWRSDWISKILPHSLSSWCQRWRASPPSCWWRRFSSLHDVLSP